jgi:hypothetical protein
MTPTESWDVFVSGQWVGTIRETTAAAALKKAKRHKNLKGVTGVSVRIAGGDYTRPIRRPNPALNARLGKWIHARAVRFRKQAGRIVMDIKKHV